MSEEDEGAAERIVFYKYHREGEDCEGRGRCWIKIHGDFTGLLLSGELLRTLCGCQVVQSCQNQTASLLLTRRRSLSAVFFSKCNHFKSLFKQTKEKSTLLFS